MAGIPINPRMIMLMPIAQITCRMMTLYRGLNVQLKVMITASTIDQPDASFNQKTAEFFF